MWTIGKSKSSKLKGLLVLPSTWPVAASVLIELDVPRKLVVSLLSPHQPPSWKPTRHTWSCSGIANQKTTHHGATFSGLHASLLLGLTDSLPHVYTCTYTIYVCMSGCIPYVCVVCIIQHTTILTLHWYTYFPVLQLSSYLWKKKTSIHLTSRWMPPRLYTLPGWGAKTNPQHLPTVQKLDDVARFQGGNLRFQPNCVAILLFIVYLDLLLFNRCVKLLYEFFRIDFLEVDLFLPWSGTIHISRKHDTHLWIWTSGTKCIDSVCHVEMRMSSNFIKLLCLLCNSWLAQRIATRNTCYLKFASHSTKDLQNLQYSFRNGIERFQTMPCQGISNWGQGQAQARERHIVYTKPAKTAEVLPVQKTSMSMWNDGQNNDPIWPIWPYLCVSQHCHHLKRMMWWYLIP